MRLVFHPEIYSDISQIMEYYGQVANKELADEFCRELLYSLEKAGERPGSFAICERDIRRVNLQRFPYYFLFRIIGDSVRILVVRHHNRHPSFGLERQ